MKTSELTGAALDWAVAKCEFGDDIPAGFASRSTDWAYGGPIIEREKIATNFSMKRECWFAENFPETKAEAGPTPLIAAMRCYVASKLGDTIDIPEELQ